MENKILKWKTLEFPHYEKGPGWYLTLIIIGVILTAYEFFVKDYFGAVTVLIITIIVFAFARMKPREVEVEISDKAITVNDYVLPYQSIRRFWIVHHPEAKALHLETTAYLNRLIVIQLGDENPSEVAEILREYLPESEPNFETTSHKIARKLKF